MVDVPDHPKAPAHAFNVMDGAMGEPFRRRLWHRDSERVLATGMDGVTTEWWMSPEWVREFMRVGRAFGLTVR